MISADYCRLFARYNTWQNASLIAAAESLTHEARWHDRGAFFGSIAATFNHLYWADALILARIQGNRRPHETIKHSLTDPSDWAEFKVLRTARDVELSNWASEVTEASLAKPVSWVLPDGSAEVEMSKALCVVQLFNHQTHHRGQIHAMLTAAGAHPAPTDITALP